jgi:hypothetical protein
MKRLLILTLLLLGSAAVIEAEVYTWTDEQGVVTYTDNPSRIPTRYGGVFKEGDKIIIRSPKVHKEIKKHGKKWSQAVIPENRRKSVDAALAQQRQKPLSLVMQSEVKGHLGGDQIDPAPPSMKQPESLPMGMTQPKPAPAGMKQPTAMPLGDQPKATPSGMKQPKSEDTGPQPPPTSSGMEQPDQKR